MAAVGWLLQGAQVKSSDVAAVVQKSLLLLEFDGNVLENLRRICKDCCSAVSC